MLDEGLSGVRWRGMLPAFHMTWSFHAAHVAGWPIVVVCAAGCQRGRWRCYCYCWCFYVCNFVAPSGVFPLAVESDGVVDVAVLLLPLSPLD